MEISFLKVLLNNISSLFNLSSSGSMDIELVRKYYQKIEDILKLLKPILDPIVDLEVASDELLAKECEGLGQLVVELRELFETWHPLMSRVYFVLHIESLILKSRSCSLEILDILKSYHQCLPSNYDSASLELCLQKTKAIGYEKTSIIVKEAIRDNAEGERHNSKKLDEIANFLNLKSNQELLIEFVALEKLKENAEQDEDNLEMESIGKMISLVSHMHNRLITTQPPKKSCHISIPPDFCCPLSLELMFDPVIVASGQTYERAFIKIWIDLGLTVCPKTRQTLSHTNLIPNYTVKALIANWCESNNVKLPDPTRTMTLNIFLPYVKPRSVNFAQSIRLAKKNLISSNDAHRAENPRSSSECSLPVVRNGDVVDVGRMPLTICEAEVIDMETRGKGNEFSPSSDDGSFLSSNDVMHEANRNPIILTRQHRESEFSKFRSHTFFRRTPGRFAPRVISSPALESRVDLSAIEIPVQKLIDDLKSTSIDTQREATEELRQLAKHSTDNRIVIASCGAITLLVDLLCSTDPTTQENAVTALLNLSLNDNNKSAIANAGAIEPLIAVLENGSPEAKENAAATLFSLSVMEDNKIAIGRSGAIKPLVELLGKGTPRGKKDAATALFNLSIFHENKGRIVQAGAVKCLIELMDPAKGMVDKAVAVLANLTTIPEGRVEIYKEGGLCVLVEVVELGSSRGKENAAAALLQLCMHSTRFCNMILQEGAVPPLVALSQSGTPRAKEKAQALLNCFRNQRHGNPRRS